MTTGETEPQHIDIEIMMIMRVAFLALTLASHEAALIRDSAHGAIDADGNAVMKGGDVRVGAIATLQQVHTRTEGQARRAFPLVSSLGRTLVVYITGRASGNSSQSGMHPPTVTSADIMAILNRLNTCARAKKEHLLGTLALGRPPHLPTPTELIRCMHILCTHAVSSAR